jgi:hypothetical protein
VSAGIAAAEVVAVGYAARRHGRHLPRPARIGAAAVVEREIEPRGRSSQIGQERRIRGVPRQEREIDKPACHAVPRKRLSFGSRGSTLMST